MKNKANERLQFLLDHLNLTVAGLAKSISLKNNQVLYHVTSGRYNFSPKVVNMIKTVYPHISENWLITGDGAPLIQGMENYKPLAERVKIIMDHFYISKEKFAYMLDLEIKEVENVVIKKINPPSNIIQKIIEAFPTVSEEWLRNFKGDMLLKDKEAKEEEKLQNAIQNLDKYSDLSILDDVILVLQRLRKNLAQRS